MKLKEYLEEKKGVSILSTADSDGKCTTAIYSKPRIMKDNTVAFIMRERLTYHNVRNNPHAAYMFIEHNPGYQGIRLFLTKIREDNDPATAAGMSECNGQTYYFCSLGCKKAFDKEPEKYLGKADEHAHHD